MASCGSGVVVAAGDYATNKFITYSPDCQNLLGGGSTILLWNARDVGASRISSESRGGVLIDAIDNRRSRPKLAQFYTPDCLWPLGGGKTQIVRDWYEL